MRSMTGHGRGEAARMGVRVSVEVSTVNRKQGEIIAYLPRELESLEPKVRDRAGRDISRGRAVIKVNLEVSDNRLQAVSRINQPLAQAYWKELESIGKAIGKEFSADVLMRLPGVMKNGDDCLEAPKLWPVVEKAVDHALHALVRMRESEGKHLLKSLAEHIRIMKRSLRSIRKQAPEVKARYREQLRNRIEAAGFPIPAPEDERLLKEIVYFADRSDITEEITRLESHFEQFKQISARDGSVGRSLDFLAQEMNREINTIGSKANDSLIAQEVVHLKTELEKFREQVQNIE